MPLPLAPALADAAEAMENDPGYIEVWTGVLILAEEVLPVAADRNSVAEEVPVYDRTMNY